MSTIKILITGSNGQLGQELQSIAKDYPEFEFDFRDKSSLDITDPESIIGVINSTSYDYCINCAAYTHVDKAESEIEKCYEINAYAPMLLGMMCADNNTRLIHISSDYVYHSNPNRPLLESDECNPQGIYAKSKLEGEENILGTSEHHIILRTSWLYSSFGNNFVKIMLKLAESKSELSIVNDQLGTPTYALDLATDIINIIKVQTSDRSQVFGGIYNYSNLGKSNWYEFAQEIFRNKNISIKLQPIPSIGYPTPAPRPKWSIMDKSKISSSFNLKIRNWKDAMVEMLSKL